MNDVEASPLEEHLGVCPRCVAHLSEIPGSDPLVDDVSGWAQAGGEAADAPTVAPLVEHLRQSLAPAGRAPSPQQSGASTPAGHDTPPPPAALPPQPGRYRLLRQLGAGGMG